MHAILGCEEDTIWSVYGALSLERLHVPPAPQASIGLGP